MNRKQEKKDLDFYLGLDYPITIHREDEEGFVAEIEDLPGCMTQAETLDEVYASIQEARKVWITATYENREEIPLPIELEEYKGRILVRIPRHLHRQIARTARKQGISLNKYITNILVASVHGELLTEQVSKLTEVLSIVWEPKWREYPIFGNNEMVINGTEMVKLIMEETTVR